MIPRFECHRVLPNDALGVIESEGKRARRESSGGATETVANILDAVKAHNKADSRVLKADTQLASIEATMQTEIDSPIKGGNEPEIAKTYVAAQDELDAAEAEELATDEKLPESLRGHREA